MAGPDGEGVRRRFVEDMGARDPAVALWIADMMSAVPLPIANAVFRQLTAWDGTGPLARCDVPALILRPELDWEDVRLQKIKPDLTVGVTVGAGHFRQIEVPDQVNAMIDRFLELAGS
jgi:pimeloyl-ACP methyl ester carboxylesterase